MLRPSPIGSIVEGKERGLYYVDGDTWQVGCYACCCRSGRQPSWRFLGPEHAGMHPAIWQPARRLPPPRHHACRLALRVQVGERYTLLRYLGSGSFSTVCLALDNTTNEKVCGCAGGPAARVRLGCCCC